MPVSVTLCPYDGCRHPWEAGWRFCPNCGTDAFPSLPRQDPRRCEHEFDIIGPFCVACGFDTEAPFGLQPGVRGGVGIVAFAGALGLLILNATLLLSGQKQYVGLGAYLMLPLFALFFVASRLIIPRRAERTR